MPRTDRIAALILLLVAAPAVRAQPIGPLRADTIRGTVLDPEGAPLAHARVTVAPVGTPPSRPIRTDEEGDFAVVFRDPEPGTRYVVTAAYIGHAPAERAIARPAPGQPFPRADFRLARIAQRLEGMQVTLKRPRPPRADAAGELDPDVGAGATQYTVDLGNVLTGDPAAGLTEAIGTLPGVALVGDPDGGPPGISALGLDPRHTRVTLNGMALAAAALPRDGVRAGLTTASADPARAGLGAQVRVALPGGPATPTRTLRVTPEHPRFQWVDPAIPGGQGITGATVSGQLAGPIVERRLFHNVTWRADRRWTAPPTLASAGPLALQALGIGADSVARLRAIATTLGIPERTPAMPATRLTTSGSALARVDWVRDSNTTLTLETSAARTSAGGAESATALPAYGTGSGSWSLGATPRLSRYLRHVILNETSLALGAAGSSVDPYLTLPTASVLVAGSASVLLGGNPSGTSDTRRASAQLRNQTTWFTRDGRHRFQLTADLQRARSRTATRSGLGTFTFGSLADLEAGRAASFSRALADVDRSLVDDLWLLGAGDVHKPFPGLTLQYGLQLQGARVAVRPAYNPAVDSLVGRRTDLVPGGLVLNPMLGVDWQVGSWGPPRVTGPRAPTAAENARRAAAAARRGTLSAVIARRATPILAAAVDAGTRQSGLPGGARQLRCVGTAAPTPDWDAWLDTPNAVPETCADGAAASPLASGAPPVTLFAPGFDAPRAWNGTLSWRGTLLRRPSGTTLGASAAATYLRTGRQQGPFDLNFAALPRFTLPAEGDRPMFVSPASISASTGAVAARESRRFDRFAAISELRSDLATDSRQLQLGVTGGLPAWRGLAANGSATYTWLDARAEARAFGVGTTTGDPREVAWSAAAAPHHQLAITGTVAVRRLFTVALSANLATGRPYTPRVASDVNGDGYANDQAFVFDPASSGDSAVLAGMASLLATSPDAARCLRPQLGHLAARDGCRGPRTAQINAAIAPGQRGIGLGERTSIALGVNNALAAVDRLVHGAAGVRGWGQPALAAVDPVLLRVRGFDPATQSFRYAVNPRFGSTAAARAVTRAPFSLTIDVRVDVGPNRESLQIATTLRPPAGVRALPERDIRRRLPAAGAPELQAILRLRDSLALTRPQVDSLGALSRRVTAARDSVWTELARYLASLGGRYGGAETRRRWRQATADAARAIDDVLPDVRGLLAPAQRAKLPAATRARLDGVKPRVAANS